MANGPRKAIGGLGHCGGMYFRDRPGRLCGNLHL
jgi:hypothetical protein